MSLNPVTPDGSVWLLLLRDRRGINVDWRGKVVSRKLFSKIYLVLYSELISIIPILDSEKDLTMLVASA